MSFLLKSTYEYILCSVKSMVDSRAKGARVETQVRDVLREHTKLQWERVPASGALHAKHGLKGDLYVVGEGNIFCVEVKGYADDHLTSEILTGKTPVIFQWWEQTIREAMEINKVPLLIFKFDRSKIFVAFETKPTKHYRYMLISGEGFEFYVAKLDEWLLAEQPGFIK